MTLQEKRPSASRYLAQAAAADIGTGRLEPVRRAMLYATVGTANNTDAGIYHEDHGSAIDGRMPARAGFRTRVPTEKDLSYG